MIESVEDGTLAARLSTPPIVTARLDADGHPAAYDDARRYPALRLSLAETVATVAIVTAGDLGLDLADFTGRAARVQDDPREPVADRAYGHPTEPTAPSYPARFIDTPTDDAQRARWIAEIVADDRPATGPGWATVRDAIGYNRRVTPEAVTEWMAAESDADRAGRVHATPRVAPDP
jgi:hypothetical protein